MYVLIDLDGTLIDTVYHSFKPFRDGDRDVSDISIPLFDGGQAFVELLKSYGHLPIIISESHPKYVEYVVSLYFNVPYIILQDKNNSDELKNILNIKYKVLINPQNSILIGDTSLDIELGRSLQIPTILTKFYNLDLNQVTKNPKLGDYSNHIKYGPTYSVWTFDEINIILASLVDNLPLLEAAIQSGNSNVTINLKSKYIDYKNNSWIEYIGLARQQEGECDIFAAGVKYKEFQRENRSLELLNTFSNSISNYLNFLIDQFKILGDSFDYFTFVADKSSTKPKDKMKSFFNLINSPIQKVELLEWSSDVSGSIRNEHNFSNRFDFVYKFLKVKDGIYLKNKNIVILDDQFTTGATADAIGRLLKEKGVMNIVFISMFQMINNVNSQILCDKCKRHRLKKIINEDGSVFYSCVSSKYGGNGCGNKVSIWDY